MRLFIAVNFDRETRERLAAVQGRLAALGKARLSPPEQLHLTLAFLGEVPPGREGAARAAMDAVEVPALALTFSRLGRFSRKGGDLWWAGLEENKPLETLQRELARQLTARGFFLEDRRFSPHITLARAVRLAAPPDLGALLGEPFSTSADAICLMRSERVGGRLTYTQRHRRSRQLDRDQGK